MELRKAEQRDLNAIMNLLNQLSPSNDELNKEVIKEIFNNINQDKNYFLCVIEDNNTIIGTGTILIQMNLSHKGKPYGHIENIVVDENHRKKGVGKDIINFLINKAKENNCYKVILNCKNEIVPFYQGCTMKETGVQMRLDL
jgi:glucosamine-phosphate N-acetyltransferase